MQNHHNDVAQVLDAEFEAIRAFIDADAIREEDRPVKIFEVYPCFKDAQNVCFIFYYFLNYLHVNYVF